MWNDNKILKLDNLTVKEHLGDRPAWIYFCFYLRRVSDVLINCPKNAYLLKNIICKHDNVLQVIGASLVIIFK